MLIEEIKVKYEELNNSYNNKVGQKESVEKEIELLKTDIEGIQTSMIQYEKEILFLQNVNSKSRQQIVSKMEQIVTDGLRVIFHENESFKIVFEPKRNRMDAKFLLVKEDGSERDVIDSNGGGKCDIISVLLMIILLELYKPAIGGPIILDESLKFLSKEYQSYAAEFLREYSERTGRQIILVSHIEEIIKNANKIFRVELENNVSKITEIENKVYEN